MTSSDLAIALPPSWRRTSDPARGVLVAARPPGVPASGVPPTVRLCCQRVAEQLGPWRHRSLTELALRVDDFELEDEDDYEADGHDVAYRRFAHRADGVDLLSDQWAWLVDGLGVTLTCSVAREDYADWCDVFEVIAETVDPTPAALGA